jgi:hypothetical protein
VTTTEAAESIFPQQRHEHLRGNVHVRMALLEVVQLRIHHLVRVGRLGEDRRLIVSSCCATAASATAAAAVRRAAVRLGCEE